MPSPAVTLTGTLHDTSGTGIPGKVVLTLVNYGSALPRVTGTSIIANQQYTAQAAANGTFSVTFWGNYQLLETSSYYEITVYGVDAAGAVSSAANITDNYQFNAPGSFNLSAINPIASVPISLPPSTILLTNNTWTGNNAFASASFGGPITIPTLAAGDDSTNAASTAFVEDAVDSLSNGILIVGTSTGQYASLQAAHDASPASGGTIFVTATGTPFGAAGTTACTITKPIHVIFDDQVFTYSGSAAQAILISSVNAVFIEGSGNGNGQPSGSTASRGTQIVVTNTATNGLDANIAPGLILRNFTLLGPASGTGKGLIVTGNSANCYDLSVRAFGGDGVTIDGTRGNSNLVNLNRVTSISNSGWGFNIFGVNANLIIFHNTSGTNNALGNYQIATATNVFLGLHSQTSGTGIGVTFPSGGSNNWGNIYSEVGDETTAVAFASGASNNWIFLSSQLAFTNSGTNNTVQTNRLLASGGAVASPGYSFTADPTTGFYPLGGGGIGASSSGVLRVAFNTASIRQGSGQVYAWSSNANPSLAGNDTGFSRTAPGVIAVGNGFAADASGTLNAAVYKVAGTQIAAANLSNGTTGSGAIVLATTPTFITSIITPIAVLTAATPTTAAGQVGLGTTNGFGNGAAGTAVTTTALGTGSGPATPQTVVKYLEVDVAGTKFWIPLVQ